MLAEHLRDLPPPVDPAQLDLATGQEAEEQDQRRVLGRQYPGRIGVDPKTGHAVMTSRPVTEIVPEALLAEVNGSGPASASGGRDLALSVTIEDFRLDEIGGYRNGFLSVAS